MADKRFDNSHSNGEWRKIAKTLGDIYEDQKKKEEKFLEKKKIREKYASVVNIITKELLKRKNIQYTYVRLYPVIKEIIESSKYLSSRYTEEDFANITSYVVEQCHHILKNEKETDTDERNV